MAVSATSRIRYGFAPCRGYAGTVVIATAVAHIQVFGNCDLHMIDIVVVPDWLEDAIAKAEDQHVLHSFFAQIVASDAEDPGLFQQTKQMGVVFLALCRSCPKGFSMIKACASSIRYAW